MKPRSPDSGRRIFEAGAASSREDTNLVVAADASEDHVKSTCLAQVRDVCQRRWSDRGVIPEAMKFKARGMPGRGVSADGEQSQALAAHLSASCCWTAIRAWSGVAVAMRWRDRRSCEGEMSLRASPTRGADVRDRQCCAVGEVEDSVGRLEGWQTHACCVFPVCVKIFRTFFRRNLLRAT